MRRLVVCCDGTWNTPEQMQGGVPAPTNVVRIFHALEQGDDQLCYYHPGVGTGPGLIDKVAGGGVGTGLSANIKSAYAWLAAHYEPGDAVCLFGFSRGAFTVRSLAGMIGACGLPPIPADLDPTERWARVDEQYAAYRPGAVAAADEAVPITFLGVWDTVGSLGVPESLGTLRIIDDLTHGSPRFHDTALGSHVRHARHAVALDERRGPFVPTLWTNLPLTEPDRTAEQVWFPGNHCDVGGGQLQTGLSDGALQWMIEEAQACVPELRWRADLVEQLRPEPGDVVHDESVGLYRFLAPTPRATPFLDPRRLDAATGSAGKDTVNHLHVSAYRRQAAPPIAVGSYRSGHTLALHETRSCEVYATQPWNWTGLYLTAGRYRLEARGEWLDRTGSHDADGVRDGRLHLPDLTHLPNAAAGWIQQALKGLTDDEAATFLGAPRLAGAPWMALLGAVAAPEFDGTGRQVAYPQVTIPTTPSELQVVEGAEGYFYAYANDAWGMYGDNRGSLSLTITRIG